MSEEWQLSEEDRELLAQIETLGAATPIEVAVKTLRQPDEVRPKLEQLYQAGLLQRHRRRSDYEPHIYLLTPEGKRYAAGSVADHGSPRRRTDE
jgi:DNA-binding MarR family transcriptional regulator